MSVPSAFRGRALSALPVSYHFTSLRPSTLYSMSSRRKPNPFLIQPHSGLNGRGSPNVPMNGMPPQVQRERQGRNGSVNVDSLNGSPVGAPQPAQQPSAQGLSGQHQPQQQQPQQQQQQQQRPAYPWSQRRLQLPPPVTIPKPGVAPPTNPSPSPFPRYGHALPATATATGELFLFGGLVRETVRNDLYLLSTRDLSATLLQTAGEVPSPRVGHASALVGSVLIVWGGDTKTSGKVKPGDKQDDGLYLLNLGTCPSLSYYPAVLTTLLAMCSLSRVDPRSNLWPCSRRSVWSRCNHGWVEVLYVRWSSRRGVPERPVGI